MVFFLCSACSVSVFRLHPKKPAQTGRPVGVVFRGHHEGPPCEAGRWGRKAGMGGSRQDRGCRGGDKCEDTTRAPLVGLERVRAKGRNRRQRKLDLKTKRRFEEA